MAKSKRGPACQCHNHIGKPKSQHKTADAALHAIVRRHMRHGGGFTVYPCPTKPGVFHVATVRSETPPWQASPARPTPEPS